MTTSSKWTAAGIVALIALIIIVVIAQRNDDEVMRPAGDVSTSEPARSDYTYVNERFGFSILVPKGWRVQERTGGVSPSVTIYKADSTDAAPQSYTDNVTHVSIMPVGTETGSIPPWQSSTSTLGTADAAATLTTYRLTDGTAWAYSLTPSPLPMGWKSWGFMYAAVEVRNVSERCDRDGVEVPVRECNALAGDVMRRSGSIDADEARELARVRASFVPSLK
jgi:hypothetical protein